MWIKLQQNIPIKLSRIYLYALYSFRSFISRVSLEYNNKTVGINQDHRHSCLHAICYYREAN